MTGYQSIPSESVQDWIRECNCKEEVQNRPTLPIQNNQSSEYTYLRLVPMNTQLSTNPTPSGGFHNNYDDDNTLYTSCIHRLISKMTSFLNTNLL